MYCIHLRRVPILKIEEIGGIIRSQLLTERRACIHSSNCAQQRRTFLFFSYRQFSYFYSSDRIVYWHHYLLGWLLHWY